MAANAANAQVLLKAECGTKTPAAPLFVTASLNKPGNVLATTPYLMKIFITVFANDDGSNVSAPDTAIMRQVINMKNFYAPHNICFILAGIQHINSTDMNNHDASNEALKLSLFVVGGCMNIFVHQNLNDNSGALNGIAYGIPSYNLSIVGSAVNSTSNISTLAHEMGHDFGLYHTFETWQDSKGNATAAENVARSGICQNCALKGDLLCDTEADRDEGVNASCKYTGTMTDSCGVKFAPNTNNIMTYGNRACRNFFTTQQGTRARDIIIATPDLSSAIAPDNVFFAQNELYSSGRYFILARNQIVIAVNSFRVNGTASVNINGRAVVLRPGVRLSPSAGGATFIRANTICN